MSITREEKIKAAFIDLHRDINDWSDNLVKPQEHYTINFPPNSELSFTERQALLELNLSNDQKSGMKRLFVEHCSILISHFLTNLDGEGDPSSLKEGEWNGMSLIEEKEITDAENEISLIDIFYDAYAEYQEGKNDQRN